MSLQTYVIFANADTSSIHIGETEILDTLDSKEERIAVQLKEVLESVQESVRDALETEGDLQIEISGSLDLKASGGINYLFYNIGGEVNKNNTMKVVLTTKITPKSP